MSWFSKENTRKTSDLQLFISEFPAWAAIHSASLADKLQKEDSWRSILTLEFNKSNLINCLVGAHLFYLTFSEEGSMAALLFGNDIYSETIKVIPEEARNFYVLAVASYQSDLAKGTSNIENPLDEFYKVKIDLLDAKIAFVIDQVVNDSDMFTNRIGDIFPILNQLRIGQLEWLQTMVNKWKEIK